MPRDLSLTMSDFDPEHEALASTRELHIDEEPDFAINTSTLDRAFPDFSQLPPSDEDEMQAEDEFSDHSLSMELGRGPSKPRRVDDSRDSVMSFENSVRSSSPAVRVEYPTPQKQSQPVRSSTRRAVSENLRKDAQLRRATQAQNQKQAMSPQVSKSQRDQRRSLSDMHAKVRESYDGSFLGDERPVQTSTNSRSTRFANPNQSQEIADAVDRASREAYAKEMRKPSSHSNSGTPRKASSTQAQYNQNNQNNTMGDTMTRNSFLLPDLPNISELVSGVYEDGTPVFPRQSKLRSTRFVSPPHDATDVSMTREHMPLDAVPIPDDEKALFVNLRLLQDKVAELQMFKTDAEKRLESYRTENVALKAGRSRNSDKYDADEGDYKKSSKRFASENQKLEAANVALQNQLDIADRKAHVQEAAVKRLNQDRESAISQLGVAYLETRELKIENEALRQENIDLKSQLNRRNQEQDTGDSEAMSSASEVDDSQMYTERSGDISRGTRDLTSRSTRSNPKDKRQDDSRSKISTQVDKEIFRLEKERAEEALFSLDVPSAKRTSGSKKSRSEAPRVSGSKSSRKQPNTSKQRVKRVVVEDVSEPLEVTEQSRAQSDVDELTLLSVIDENEISRLRRTLEEERLLRKQRRSSAAKDVTANETANSTRQGILKTPLPRKSSLREPKPAIPRPASATGDLTSRSVAMTEEDEDSLVVPTVDRHRRHSDHSVASVASRKKRAPKEDMTSAFILPDITLNHAELAASNPSRLPEAAQKALDDLAQHNGKNCTVCKNVLPNDGQCDHEPINVPQPVPASERMPEPSVHNPEPTIRPSQPPAVALANVLKALEDELSHLKMQLAGYQSAYNKLDASISKRQRKSLTEKVETLIREIDQKSDQIYALYDVLEDHKTDSGNHMTEREMEQTLESIGIDVTKSVDLEGDSELPWEGIESTAELTGRT